MRMTPLSLERRRAATRHDEDPLAPVRRQLAMIRDGADDQIARDIRELRSFYADLPEHQLSPMIARAARELRDREQRQIRELTAGLDRKARTQLFNETLDPRLLSAH